MQNNINVTRNLFDEKNVVDKLNYYWLFNGKIRQPVYPEGENYFNIIRCKSEEMYGRYSGNIKIEFILEDDAGNQLTQLFILKDGKNNNFGKFIYQVLGYEPEDEFSLKELEGKKILATIAIIIMKQEQVTQMLYFVNLHRPNRLELLYLEVMKLWH